MKIRLSPDDTGKMLARSAAQLDPATSDKLRSARENALRNLRGKPRSALPLWLDNSPISPRWGIALLLVAIISGGALYWQNTPQHDHAEIDIAILTDELPVDMYLD